MNTLFEKNKLMNYIGEDLYNSLKKYKAFIAGGTIVSLFTNSEINDVDVYFRSSQDLANFLLDEMEGTWILAKTDKAFLFKYNDIEVQTIYFNYFNSCQEIFNTFDFTVCMGAFDFEKESFVFDDNFIKHNAQKILKFNSKTAYPIVSALRVDKYNKKGYKISKAEYIRIMLTIMTLNITSYEQLKEQMGGMYGENYDKLLQQEEHEGFDLVKIVDKMKDMVYDECYFKKSEPLSIDDGFDRYIYKELGIKSKGFKVKDKYYEVLGDNIYETENVEEFELVDVSDIMQFPIYRYKYVDNSLHSFYSNKFEYKVGEYIKPEKERKNKWSNYGIYVTSEDSLDVDSSYSGRKNKTMLELRIDSIEDLIEVEELFNTTFAVNKAFVTRVVRVDKNDEVEEESWI